MLALLGLDRAIAAEGFDWDIRVNLGAAAVTLVPTSHWSARNLSDRNMSLWASFVIEAPGGRIYVVADSGYNRIVWHCPRPRLHLVPDFDVLHGP